MAVSYVKCGFCTAKNHCAACGGELSALLAERPGIRGAEVDLPGHTLRLACDMGREELEDLLDGMGLLTE